MNNIIYLHQINNINTNKKFGRWDLGELELETILKETLCCRRGAPSQINIEVEQKNADFPPQSCWHPTKSILLSKYGYVRTSHRVGLGDSFTTDATVAPYFWKSVSKQPKTLILAKSPRWWCCGAPDVEFQPEANPGLLSPTIILNTCIRLEMVLNTFRGERSRSKPDISIFFWILRADLESISLEISTVKPKSAT